MKQTLIRLILFTILALLFAFVVAVKYDLLTIILAAFVGTYILEGFITEKLK